MNNERALTVLLGPHVSEKTSQSAGTGRLYAFKVIKDATKPEVRGAVEKMFDVKVESVRIVNVKRKSVRSGRTQGYHQGWKKAYVTLGSGQEIDLTGSRV